MVMQQWFGVIGEHCADLNDKDLSPVHTGDYSRRFWRLLPKSTIVAEFGDCRRIRRQSPFSATVAEFGDYSRQCGQGFSCQASRNESFKPAIPTRVTPCSKNSTSCIQRLGTLLNWMPFSRRPDLANLSKYVVINPNPNSNHNSNPVLLSLSLSLSLRSP